MKKGNIDEYRLSGKSEIDLFSIGQKEADAIKLFKHNIDKMLIDAIMIEMEKMGHSFESYELFLEFCKTYLSYYMVQQSGHPLNKNIIVKLKNGEPIAMFNQKAVITDSFGIEINLNRLQ